MGDLVLATVGLCGVGKSEATRFLVGRLDAELVYFGGLVLNELRSRGLEVTPGNERRVREELRAERGMDAVAQLGIEPIRRGLAAEKSVVVDGLYSFSEHQLLKEEFGERLCLIALHAAKATRYNRLLQRSERPLQPDQVDERDLSEVNHLEKAPPIVLAEHHVINDGSLDVLHSSLEAVLSSLLGSGIRERTRKG